MQPDTLIQNVYDPQSLNRYSFERSNPQKNVDPDGHLAYAAVAVAVIGYGLVKAGVEAYIQISVTGRIYSVERMATSFTLGVIEATAFALTRSLFVSTVASIYTLYDFQSSVKEAKKHKLDNKPEAEKVITEEDLKCGLAVDCQMQVIEGQGKPRVTSAVSSASPSISQPSSQTNSASSVNPKSSSTSTGSGGGGYVAGVGYVTPEGRIYPTNNPNWKPNPNAPRYTPPPPKPKSSKGGKK